jgi:DinB family protein
MDFVERQHLIHQYRDGCRAVTAALTDLTEAELDKRPADGAWTARDVIHHLADSETTSYIRLRKVLAEDEPVIDAYDEARFATMLHYDRPIEPSLQVLRAVRQATAELLEVLEPHEWARAGVHSESGRYSVETWLEIYASHAHDHADQIRRAREGRI